MNGVIEAFRIIFNFIWDMLNISFRIDGVDLKIWHISAFAALLAVTINGMFSKKEGKEGAE